MKINYVNFQKGNYHYEDSKKKQIVLHHTVSSGSAYKVINYWRSIPARIATHFIIDRNGVIFQLFNTRYWASHIGKVTKEVNDFNLQPRNFSKYSIGIELVSLGGLRLLEGQFYDAYGNIYRGNDVIEYSEPYRGYRYFQVYTDAQISSVLDLIKLLSKKWEIPINFSEKDLEVNEKALSLTPGLYSHTSYRYDKSDIHPQPTLITALENL